MPSPHLSPQELEDVVETLGNGLQLVENILPHIGEGLQLWDKRGHLLYCNAVSEEHFGPMAEMVGHSYVSLLSRCLNEQGLSLPNSQFPLVRVLEDSRPASGLIIQSLGARGKWLELSAYPIQDNKGSVAGVLSTSHEVSVLVERSRQLEMDAHYDALTGLPNRSILLDRLNMAIAHSKRSGDILAVCLMDLDGFKPINDDLGHEAGDRLLQEIARRLLVTLREEDTAVRLGGDEFVILLNGLKNERECEALFMRLLETIAEPFTIDDVCVQVTASLGVTLFPNDGADADGLLRHADQAMYKAKDKGKNDFFLFDPTLESRHRANRNTVNRMRKALANGQYELYYQPQVNCAKGTVVGVEALIRWNHPVLGLRFPGEFLPLIEQDVLIVEIGEWVMNEALRQLQQWQAEGIDVSIGVNISAQQLLHGDFGQRLDDLLRRYPEALMSRLEIEVLETAALEDLKAVGRLVSKYQELGISFALDDFGTGFSSLAHLKHLSVNTLKIDQSFVRDMLNDPGDLAIVQGVLGLSEAFQARTIAEGVESIDQILLMLGMGCSIMQGYGIAHPMQASRFPGWFKSFNKNPLWSTATDHYPSREDFDLLLMEVIHRHWREQVKLALRNKGLTQKSLPANYDDCRITAWYRDKGSRIYGSMPEFHELDQLHHRVHALAERLLEADDKDEASLQEQLLSASDKLVKALKRFRANLAQRCLRD